MNEKGSVSVARQGRGKREKTRFSGVYSRKIVNRRTGKLDTAFDVSYRDKDGKKQWELIGYASDGVNAPYASRRRGAILDGIAKGEKPKRERAGYGLTFGEAWAIFEEKWLPNLAQPEQEKNRYKWYLQDRFAHRRLDNITALDMEDLKAAMLKKLSPATVRLTLGDVRRIYRKLISWGLYDGNVPTNGVAMPKVDNARVRFLSPEEALNLLDALKKRSKTWHDVAFLSLHTGMRKGEVLELKGEDIDFVGGRILVKDAKTGSRTVHMTDEVRVFLEDLSPGQAEYVFRNQRDGGPVNPKADASFVYAVKKCKLNEGVTDRRRKVVFHTLRHTYCSWLAMSGVPLFTIGELVGHSSVEMTKRYSHLCPDARQEAAARIGPLLRQAIEKQEEKAMNALASSDARPPGIYE